MLKRHPLWETVLGMGFLALVSGVVLIATDPTVADHRIGLGLAIGGVVIMGIAVFASVILKDKKASKGSEAAPVSVTSIGQIGGQTAASITNIGVQPRTLAGKETRGIVRELSKYAGTEAQVCSVTLDAESRRFAGEIDAILKEAGWATKPISSTLLTSEQGVGIRCPDSKLPDAARELAERLEGLGFHVMTSAGVDIANGIEILVLTN